MNIPLHIRLASSVVMLLCRPHAVRAWTTAQPRRLFQRIGAETALRAFNSYRYSDDFFPLSAQQNSEATNGMVASNLTVDVKTLSTGAAPAALQENSTFSSGRQKEVPNTSNNSPDPSALLSNGLTLDPSFIELVHKNDSNMDEDDDSPALSEAELFRNFHFVDMFRGSANYIASHRESLVVYHIPGDWIDHEDPKIFRDLMNDISLTWLLGLKIVIVVGCRYQVEKRLGHRNKHQGMAVTDPESLRIVKEEAGYVRFEVERQLARSLQGPRGSHKDGNVVSGNFYSAQPFGIIDGVDYQYSGYVRRFETDKIHKCHEHKDIVLLTNLGVSPTGEVFNVNSEYLSASVGGALGANKVIFFQENDIELRHKVFGTRIPHLRVNEGRNLLKMNDILIQKKGFVFVGDKCPYEDPERNMLVKIGWSMHALQQGVKRVHVVSPENGALIQELYTRDGSGTMISGDLYDGIHEAKVTDVTAIHDLITPLIEQGTLVDRPRALLEKHIDEYHVYTRDDLIMGCGQLKLFEGEFAEIGCLVVNPAYRARGRGDAMLGYLERLCVKNGASLIFVLSTQTMEWFVERGFDEVSVDMLPPSRQATYNHDRGSKIYMKRISSIRDLDASELFWDR